MGLDAERRYYRHRRQNLESHISKVVEAVWEGRGLTNTYGLQGNVKLKLVSAEGTWKCRSYVIKYAVLIWSERALPLWYSAILLQAGTKAVTTSPISALVRLPFQSLEISEFSLVHFHYFCLCGNHRPIRFCYTVTLVKCW